MNYQKIYNDLMNSKLFLKNERFLIKDNAYFEGHHIIPKSLGGTGHSNRAKKNPNIVLLTAREHFLAHKLLCLIYQNTIHYPSMAFAAFAMCNLKSKGMQRHSVNSREYAFYKEEAKKVRKGVKRSVDCVEKMKNSLTGRKLSENHKQAIKLGHKNGFKRDRSGINNNRFGTITTDETKLKMKISSGKKIIDTNTNQVFDTIGDASVMCGIKRKTLNAMLTGQNRNKTKFQYL